MTTRAVSAVALPLPSRAFTGGGEKPSLAIDTFEAFSPTKPDTPEKLSPLQKLFTTTSVQSLVPVVKAAIVQAGGEVNFNYSLGQSMSTKITAHAKTIPLLEALQGYARALGIENLKEDLRRQIEKRREVVYMPPSTISDSDSEATVNSDTDATVATDAVAEPSDHKPTAETDPLEAFKTAVFGTNFKTVLDPDPTSILRALEKGDFVPNETPFERAIQAVQGYLKDTDAAGSLSIGFDAKGETTFEVNSSIDTGKLIQILELAFTKDKEVDVTSRESGKRLVDIMTKHTIYYLQANGFVKDDVPVDPRQLRQALFKVMVAKGQETKQNAGIIFETKPEEAQKDLAEFQRSLTLADQMFFGKIFASGKCRRPAVFEKVIEQLTSTVKVEEPKPKPAESSKRRKKSTT